MKLYSFDVYDTLLTRRVAVPADLFQLLGEQLRTMSLIPDGPGEFATQRARAEVAARQTAPAGEVRLSEIYAKLAEACGWNAAQTQQALELELRVESDNTQAVPAMAETVQRARANGFRVMFLSDMYLPAPFIAELLRREGFLIEGDEPIVSSEQRLAKHDGRMFQMIWEKHPEIKEWQHTGDHPRADVETPRRFKITAQHETRCVLSAHERFVRGAGRSVVLWRSQFAAAMKLARLEGWRLPETRRAVWESGANVVGPLWFGFAEWCLAEAQRRGIKRLYFVARDGQIFHKIASEIARQRGIVVECRYLYGSRQSWHLPGLAQLDEAAFKWIFNRQRYLTTEQVLKRVGLEPNDFKTELAALGILETAWTTDLSAEQTRRLRELLQTPAMRGAIQQRVATARDLALRYLQQEGVLDGTPYALVDIGWHGNMQRSFATLLRADEARRNLPVTGMYFGLQRRPSDTALDQFVGYWPEMPVDRVVLRTLNVTLLEMMAAADHGTVLGFREAGGGIKPILDGDRNEAALTWGLDVLQNAALKFATTWLDFSPLSPDDRAKFQSLSRQVLLNFIAAPSLAEATVWAQFPHSGEQIERHKESVAPVLSFWESLAFVRQPQRRPAGWWAEGSYARQPNVVLAFYLLNKQWKSQRQQQQ